MMDGWFQSHATPTYSAELDALAWMRGGKRSVRAANVFSFRLAQVHSCTIFFSQDRIELRKPRVYPGIVEFLRDRPDRDGISWPIPERHPEWPGSSLGVKCQESGSNPYLPKKNTCPLI